MGPVSVIVAAAYGAVVGLLLVWGGWLLATGDPDGGRHPEMNFRLLQTKEDIAANGENGRRLRRSCTASMIGATTPVLSFGVTLAIVALATACGGGTRSTSAATLRACVKAHLAPGTVTRVFTHTEEGVATTNYYYPDGSETDVNVFPSVQAAKDAEAQEARLGDAHDRRTGNVLHSGGGPADGAVTACLR